MKKYRSLDREVCRKMLNLDVRGQRLGNSGGWPRWCMDGSGFKVMLLCQ